ncbi:MAG: hypothetical protein M5U01_19275 [Ardenticatenaceae bacterium]|nr:hypothetical protein [Ardenticatenaceae bacterium]
MSLKETRVNEQATVIYETDVTDGQDQLIAPMRERSEMFGCKSARFGEQIVKSFGRMLTLGGGAGRSGRGVMARAAQE